ncbi:MAG: hypothetical protein HY529_02435 [Chloroflexi bacterium]|nr:hypothetical protein [Chloroflexota bacterium]
MAKNYVIREFIEGVPKRPPPLTMPLTGRLVGKAYNPGETPIRTWLNIETAPGKRQECYFSGRRQTETLFYYILPMIGEELTIMGYWTTKREFKGVELCLPNTTDSRIRGEKASDEATFGGYEDTWLTETEDDKT